MNSNNPDLTKKTDSSINAPSKLFKPIIITQDLIKKSESNISSNIITMPQLSSIHNEKNIPLVYHQFPLGSSPQIPSIYYPEIQIAKINDITNNGLCSTVNVLPIIRFVIIAFVLIVSIETFICQIFIKMKKLIQMILYFVLAQNLVVIRNIANVLKLI